MSEPSHRRMTKNQKQILVEYVEANPEILFSHGNSTPTLVENCKKKWEELITELHLDPTGPSRTVRQWKNALNELKTNVRRKARLYKLNSGLKGPRPLSLKKLTETEEKLLSVMQNVQVNGIANLPEAESSLKPDLEDLSYMLETGDLDMDSSSDGDGLDIKKEVSSDDELICSDNGEIIHTRKKTRASNRETVRSGAATSSTPSKRKPSPPPPVKNKVLHELLTAKKQMDDAFLILKSISEKPYAQRDECEIYGELLVRKLKNMDESLREMVMHEIDNLIFRAKRDPMFGAHSP